jgi:ABC-type spermidine/putrescine transport system permease subunit II
MSRTLLTPRGVVAGLLLGLLALVQITVLTLPAALVLADRPASAWTLMWTQATAGTAVLCNAVAVAAVLVLGLPASLALWRWHSQGVFLAVLLAPLLLPAGLLADSETTTIGLAVLLAAHCSLGIAFGTGCGLVALLGVDRDLLRASASAGIGRFGTYRRVVLPLIAPGILAGVLLAGASSMAMSLVAIAKGPPAAITALSGLGASPILAVAGVALLLCAVVLSAVTLLDGSKARGADS